MKYLLPALIAFILIMGTWQGVRAEEPPTYTTIDLWADERVERIERQMRDMQRQQRRQEQQRQHEAHKEYWEQQQRDSQYEWDHRRGRGHGHP